MDGWMNGWMDNEKRMMVEGERELRRVSMTRLGCLVAYPKSGESFKVRPTRHLLQSPNFSESAQYTVYTQGLTQVPVTLCSLLEANLHFQMIHNRTISDVEVNIALFCTGER